MGWSIMGPSCNEFQQQSWNTLKPKSGPTFYCETLLAVSVKKKQPSDLKDLLDDGIFYK